MSLLERYHPATTARLSLTKPLLPAGARLTFDALVVIWVAAAFAFWRWWLQPDHILPGARYWIVTAGLVWLFFLQTFFVVVSRRARAPAADLPDRGSFRVAMVVTKAPSEPFSVVQKTLEAMLRQTWPHDTWLADEDPSPLTIAWCEAHEVRISTRKGIAAYHRNTWPRRTRCKEGNLAYFYDTYGYGEYDIVSQLDADHVPSPTYLQEIVRGFVDPRVGYVSAPSICSANAAESWPARARLYTEAGFHGIFQCGYANGLAPMCIGSHYAVRTRALREVGGLGPDLAEDHSTTLILNAGGWRGVHAIDAIAVGDGPSTASDFCTQEFQWARSLMTLLLAHTPRYFGQLPLRLKAQFLLCQSFYSLTALTLAVLLSLAPLAVLFDIRYADVTYPAFVLHAVLPALVLLALTYVIRCLGHFRPKDAPILSWERIFFPIMQWPWVLWGTLLAFRDRLVGGFVDFRITPKGDVSGTAKLPKKIVLTYSAIALINLLPLVFVDSLENANGFYLLCTFIGTLYTLLVIVLIWDHLRMKGAIGRTSVGDLGLQLGIVPALLALLVSVAVIRGDHGVHALTLTANGQSLLKPTYSIAGAGFGDGAARTYAFNADWFVSLERSFDYD